ncbi:hypothetical protein GQ43DRAFT_461247 [Delitschia confertaspora ATCC 74209]|uniref:Uncharacterized protein n=1 Tax=Delitschia confertaspora ATCC 74209 TaxID=1513339 RepID=A0A9P4JR41_9PLEO|nr:hypothetical protein GQ43DRAFT_461247 [Delitschia confertaspora ATCC 74209]
MASRRPANRIHRHYHAPQIIIYIHTAGNPFCGIAYFVCPKENKRAKGKRLIKTMTCRTAHHHHHHHHHHRPFPEPPSSSPLHGQNIPNRQPAFASTTRPPAYPPTAHPLPLSTLSTASFFPHQPSPSTAESDVEVIDLTSSSPLRASRESSGIGSATRKMNGIVAKTKQKTTDSLKEEQRERDRALDLAVGAEKPLALRPSHQGVMHILNTTPIAPLQRVVSHLCQESNALRRAVARCLARSSSFALEGLKIRPKGVQRLLPEVDIKSDSQASALLPDMSDLLRAINGTPGHALRSVVGELCSVSYSLTTVIVYCISPVSSVAQIWLKDAGMRTYEASSTDADHELTRRLLLFSDRFSQQDARNIKSEPRIHVSLPAPSTIPAVKAESSTTSKPGLVRHVPISSENMSPYVPLPPRTSEHVFKKPKLEPTISSPSIPSLSTYPARGPGIFKTETASGPSMYWTAVPTHGSKSNTDAAGPKPMATPAVCANCHETHPNGFNGECRYHPGLKRVGVNRDGQRICKFSCCGEGVRSFGCKVGRHTSVLKDTTVMAGQKREAEPVDSDTCANCHRVYPEGFHGACHYHTGQKRVVVDKDGQRLTMFSCCKGNLSSVGCTVGKHVSVM